MYRQTNIPTDGHTLLLRCEDATKKVGIKGGQKSPISMNTIYCYYIPFKDNLRIIFPKFEVSSINDGSH